MEIENYVNNKSKKTYNEIDPNLKIDLDTIAETQGEAVLEYMSELSEKEIMEKYGKIIYGGDIKKNVNFPESKYGVFKKIINYFKF